MEREFQRYHLSRFRKFVGLLEFLGGFGLGLGYYFSRPLLCVSSAGLSVLMLLGVIVRLKTRDPWFQIAPAFALMFVNVYLCYQSIYS